MNGGFLPFDTPVVFQPGLAYDVVGKYSTNTNTLSKFSAGGSPPADVVACYPAVQYIDGDTPGAYTASDGVAQLLVTTEPTAASSGGGGSFTFIG